MTNGEKYKDIEERTKKFLEFCNAQSCCTRCLLYDKCSRGVECAYAWEELEYEEELLPCPFCGGEATINPIYNDVPETGLMVTLHHVRCPICDARTGDCDTEEKAIKQWNRRN